MSAVAVLNIFILVIIVLSLAGLLRARKGILNNYDNNLVVKIPFLAVLIGFDTVSCNFQSTT